jgi:diguanylate cyclase (GGDEF)-like protein
MSSTTSMGKVPDSSDLLTLERREGAEAQAAEIRHLSKPFWATVMIGAASLMAFVTFLAQSLDRNSIQASEQVFTAVLGDRAERLSDITLEYGYWDVSAENLVDELNMSWVEKTFVNYMQEELQIEGVHLVDGSGQPKLHVVEGQIAEADLLSRYGRAVNVLIEEARKGPSNVSPVPVTGIVGDLSGLYLASAVLMTTYTSSDVDITTDHVLVFAQPVNEMTLSVLADKYKLPNLHLSSQPPAFWQSALPIETRDNTVLGYFVWNPKLPGSSLLPLLAFGVLVVYLSMYLSARMFFQRATETVKALEEAKFQADKAKELLSNQARSDPLTGLGNRRYLDEKISELQNVNAREGHALLYVDLDHFKKINDTFGHDAGDKVLRHVAVVLRALANSGEEVARLGGDEFVIVIGNAHRERVLSVGRTILEHLGEPLDLEGAVCSFGASVGIAFSDNPSELLRQADVALYSAKRQGRGQMAVYSAEMLTLNQHPIRTSA